MVNNEVTERLVQWHARIADPSFVKDGTLCATKCKWKVPGMEQCKHKHGLRSKVYVLNITTVRYINTYTYSLKTIRELNYPFYAYNQFHELLGKYLVIHRKKLKLPTFVSRKKKQIPL